MLPLLLAALSGLLSGLTHPNVSLLVLLPFALVPLLFALRGAGPARGFLLGEAFGTAFWLTTVPWIAFTVHRYGEVPPAVAWLALVLVAVLLALPFAAMGWVLALLGVLELFEAPGGGDSRGPRSRFGVLWAFPAAWVAQEALRTHLFGGFPWVLLAAPLADVPALAQSAALGGVLLTSGLVALLNSLVFLLVRPGPVRSRALSGAAATLLVAGAWFLGAARLRNLDVRSRPSPPPFRVLLVQPNVTQELRFSFEARDAIWKELLSQTRRAVTEAKPALVLWPESATPWQWPWSAGLRTDLPALCRELGISVLFNTVWSERPAEDEAPFYNSALLVNAEGAVLPPYHKQRLVPFGEYVPVGWLLRRIRPISRAVPSSFTPGEGTVVLPFRGWGLGGAVCYEVVYPWIARAEARAGANLLFTLTNDSWYGTAGARRQHWQGAVFRSIETGLPLLRAAVTGITGSVDAGGRSRTIPVDGPGTMVVDMGEGPGRLGPVAPPPALLLGETFPIICAAGVLAGILRRRAFPPRRPGTDADALRTSPVERKAET